MTDLYAFAKPGDSRKSIIIFNVHMSMAVNPVGPTTREPFAPGALYEIKVDTDGDAIADVCYSVQFAASNGGTQTATVRRTQGARAVGPCDDGEIIVEQAPVSAGRGALITKAGDNCFFFGWRSDPFFFDAIGNFNQMQFTGDDFFADIGVFAHELEHTGGYTREDAIGLARKLLPDILSYDSRRPSSFPENGRTLTDDVVDPFFSMLTNGKVTGDKVGPHKDLLDEFPYVGPPHD
jgi:hypothetical protein